MTHTTHTTRATHATPPTENERPPVLGRNAAGMAPCTGQPEIYRAGLTTPTSTAPAFSEADGWEEIGVRFVLPGDAKVLVACLEYLDEGGRETVVLPVPRDPRRLRVLSRAATVAVVANDPTLALDILDALRESDGRDGGDDDA